MTAAPETPESSNIPPAEGPYAAYSPIMRQYLTMRDENPGALLLYRLGDFYESFFEDAVKVNRLLGLTLTHRGQSKGERIPMAGVPAATIDQYLARLVKLGLSVAICEQIGDPSAPRTGAMERRIVRIVTPGTITQADILPAKSDAILMAIAPSRLKDAPAGVVWLTLSNGDFRGCRCEPGTLASEIARIAPSEILVPEDKKEEFEKLAPAGVSITELPNWHFDAERGVELLKHEFHVADASAWGLEHQTEILEAINAILGYVAQTQRENAPYISPIVLESKTAFIDMDPATRRNLEITETLRADNGPTLFSTMDDCKTSMGSRTLKHWLHHPLRDMAQARARHRAVQTFLDNQEAANHLRELLAELPDIERVAGRIGLRSLRPKEAAGLRDALPHLSAISAALNAFPDELLQHCAQGAALDNALFAKLSAMLLPEPATLLREGDVIASSVDPELAQARELRDHAGEGLTELEAREREKSGISNLRVSYNSVAGYYIEIPKGQVQKAPAEYRRTQTLKNVERYTTPELKEYENKQLSAAERAAQIERRYWEELLTFLADWIQPLLAASHAAASADVLLSFAKKAQDCRWCSPVLDEKPGIEINAGRHPVVESMVEQYVPNDITLVPGRRLLVITGPNMGGKSTYMRSAALITLLAFTGSFVPATAARLGPVDKILTRIGASDDLARGRSTFMVEMTEAAAILHQATDQSLVLMDEIGRGTSTFDGLSLAAAIAEELATHTRSWTLFATHYFELTELAARCPEAANVHVSAARGPSGIVFLHDVKDGPANQSYGIDVASLAGVPARVIRAAKKLLTQLENRAVANGPQADLFADLAPAKEETAAPATPEVPHENEKTAKLIENLKELDVDALSPRQALDLLYTIQRQAKDTEN